MLFICLFTLFFYFLYVFIWMMVVWGLNFITIKIYDVNITFISYVMFL